VAVPVAPRAPSADVAVKCDLCAGVSGGPACVSACPTQAIARVDPNEVLVELRALRGETSPPPPIPRARPAWPWIVAALPVAGWLVRLFAPRTIASGAVAGALVVALAAYAVVKRVPSLRVRLRPWFVAHIALGVIAVLACAAHAGARLPSNAAGALSLAILGAVVTGAFGAIAYRALPPRLARIERGGALPEDLPARARALDDQAFRGLTGRTELLKTVFARILRPYARNKLGPLVLVARGATLREEGARLRARIDRALEGRGGDKLEGLDALIAAVVERRAITAQRAIQAALRGWLPVHLAFTAAALVLLAVHAIVAMVYR
jgi:hypothetical protein